MGGQVGRTAGGRAGGQATRIEHDSLGSVTVEASRYWGAQTQRSLLNFPIGRDRFVWTRPVIGTLGLVKQAAATANRELGLLDAERSALIVAAADEVIAGELDEHFPLVVWQTGSGTHTNMNANEVLANRANELGGGELGSKQPVHPNDHVNLGQSSNDIFPTVMHVAAATELNARLYPAVDQLCATLDELAGRYRQVVKIGRTHLQDATPITLGQELAAWAGQLRDAADQIRNAEALVRRQLAVGGTATGTGLNSHPDFGPAVAGLLAEATGLDLAVAANRFLAIGSHDPLMQLSAALRTLAGASLKVANDIRWLASGPRAGLGELELPVNEPGSSIMPGKVNPSQAEALTMVAAQVIGNDAAVAFAGTQGTFQLNAYKPVILHNVLESIGLLADGLTSFDVRCATGLAPRTDRLAANVEQSLMLATALSPRIGYDRAAQVARRAAEDGISVKEAGVALGHFTTEQYAAWVDPLAMTGPGLPAVDPGETGAGAG